MSAGMTVAELTDAHIGWQIQVGRARGGDGEFLRHRVFTLKGIRTWTYEGLTTVGLLDPTDAHGAIVGTERHYNPDTACTLLRPITAKAKRAARLAVQS